MSTPEAPSATVLIVDDEGDLREIMRRMLERRGFATLSAGSPGEALTLCREHDGPIELLLTDLGIAGESGGDLARAAVAVRPRLRVLYVSGLSYDAAVRQRLIE